MPPAKQPLTTATSSPSAATAAAAVFKRHEPNNTSLSAAAAAAALAARPTTPIRVADVQTKRTMRRSASLASSVASSENLGRPSLRRRGSSGSMTERTFRSSSPHRPASSGSVHRQTRSEDMPPLPALPVQADIAACQERPHRRVTGAGVGTTRVRVASQTLGSRDAPAWFGASKVGDPRSVRRTDPAMASPPSSPPRDARADHQPEVARTSSCASSINFSYPTRTRVGSPPVSPVETRDSVEIRPKPSLPEELPDEHHAQQPRQAKSQAPKRYSAPVAANGAALTSSDQVLVYDPNSRRMVRQIDLWAAEQVGQGSSGQLAGKQKKQTPQRAGSHLSKGTVGRTRVNIPTADHTNSEAAMDGQARSPVRHARAQVSKQPEKPAPEVAISSSRLGGQKQPQHDIAESHSKSQPLGATLATIEAPTSLQSQQSVKRQPSIVKEEPGLESDAEEEPPRPAAGAIAMSPAGQRLSSEADSSAQHASRHGANILAPPHTFGGPSETTASTPGKSQSDDDVVRVLPQHTTFEPFRPSRALQERAMSNSPIRQAHFGSVSDNLAVRHSPPPRSVSPRKSALKHSTSPNRGASPSDDTSEASGGINAREDPPIVRKKSVRVSFDDGTMVLGESASPNQLESPIIASPQNSGHRHWYSSIGRRKKELPPLDDDDDEIMKPRPALPSFGSVRERISREPHDEGERPLVRPISERLHSPISLKAAAAAPMDHGLEQGVVDQSDGLATAALLREPEDKSKIPANTSRYREPLPPVVTSVEGSGYLSDSSTTSSSGLESQGASEESVVGPSISPLAQAIAVETPSPVSLPTGTSGPSETAVPDISISAPTPPAVETNWRPSLFLIDIPGGFPQDDSDLSTTEGSRGVLSGRTESKAPLSVPPPQNVPASLREPEDSSDSESIYSDAYEDLSEVSGDGFQSLDAVLRTPPVNNTAPPVPAQNNHHVLPSSTSAAPPASSVPAAEATVPEDEWEKVKAYWRSLTTEKRAQLEQEAAEEAGIDADLEEAQPALQKPKKKKSVERRNSEKRALAVHMAQQIAAKQQKQAEEQQKQAEEQQAAERSYMIQPGTKWPEGGSRRETMQTTLRSPAPQSSAGTSDDVPRLRKSMRTNGSTTQSGAQSSRNKPQRVRPASLGAPASTALRQPSLEQPSQHAQWPALPQRRDSTGSESSFKRTRRGNHGHATGFRMSMRQTAPQPSQREEAVGKRFSLRSLSPAGSATKRDGPPVSLVQTQMRQTLRDSSRESSKERTKHGLRIPGLGSKKSGKHTAAPFSSRLSDSSDEGGRGGKSEFRSRFEDSSEDEAVSPMVLPKTMPRTLRNQDSVASTALPEELEESEELPNKHIEANANAQHLNPAISPPPQPGPTTPQPVRSGSGRLSASQTAPALLPTDRRNSSTSSKRGSLLTALRRKRHNSSSKISRPEITESAARRDTKLERNVQQLRGIPQDDSDPEADVATPPPAQPASPPRSPKLQKRVTSLAHSHSRSVLTAENVNQQGPISPLVIPSSPQMDLPSPSPGTGVDEKDILRTPLRRPSATRSGNLGTRTLSGTLHMLGSSSTSAQQHQRPAFLERRTASAGVLQGAEMSAEVGSMTEAGTVSGTALPKKKKFGVLRRMFGLSD